LDYCRRSANPVGRLLLHLFKRTSDSDLACSAAICSALQLINFWQDVDIDYAKGRIYLPQDEMARHRVTEQHLLERRCDDSWRALMRFQVARSRTLCSLVNPSGAPCLAASGSKSAPPSRAACASCRKSSMSITMFSVTALHCEAWIGRLCSVKQYEIRDRPRF